MKFAPSLVLDSQLSEAHLCKEKKTVKGLSMVVEYKSQRCILPGQNP
jgi:hypothetical protein